MKNIRRGFTLLELMIALSFAAVVLYGVTSIFTSMTKFEFEAVRKSSVDTWSQATLAKMTEEIESASLLYFPSTSYQNTSAVLGCSNWSTMIGGSSTGGALDPSAPVTKFYYCYDNTTGPIVAPSTSRITYLRRIAATGVGVACPAPTAVNPATYACNNGVVLPGQTQNDVIATDVNFVSGVSLFTYDINGPATGVNLHFLVGNPTPGAPTGGESGVPSAANITNPQTMLVQTSISLNRPYLNSND